MSDTDNSEAVFEEQKVSKRKFDPNIVIAISLGVISLCALFVSVYQTKILADQQELMTAAEKAQLWPNITPSLGTSLNEGVYKEVYFKVSNDGIGPAIIENFSLSYKGQKFESWLGVCLQDLNEKQKNDFFDNVSITNLMLKKKQIVPAGETIILFKMELNQFEKFQYLFQRFVGENQPTFSLQYSSVFKDQWIVSGPLDSDNPPVALAEN